MSAMPENPYRVGGDPSKTRDWKCVRQQVPYRICCPKENCESHEGGRAYWCDDRHKEARCCKCRTKFVARDHVMRGGRR